MTQPNSEIDDNNTLYSANMLRLIITLCMILDANHNTIKPMIHRVKA